LSSCATPTPDKQVSAPRLARIPQHHPLGEIRRLTDKALAARSEDFEAADSRIGRPSIAPEQLMRARLLPGRIQL